MKKLFVILCALLTSTIGYAEMVSITKDQFENIDVVDKALKDKYAQYKGYNGSSDKLEVVGISGASFMSEVNKMKPVDEINSDKTTLKNENELIAKRIRKLAIDSLKAEGVAFKRAEI